jgi:hypothetical protein
MPKSPTAALALALALFSSPARAQTFSVSYGGQISLHGLLGSGFGVVPHFGAFVAGDLGFGAFNVGARLTGSSLLFLLWNIGADVYAGYTLQSGLNVYFGAGGRLWTILYPVSGSFGELHGLVGVRFPSGFYLEVTPGATLGQACNVQPPAGQPCSSFQTTVTPSVGLNFGLRLRL